MGAKLHFALVVTISFN